MSTIQNSRIFSAQELHTFAILFEIPETLEKYITRLFSSEEIGAALAHPDRLFFEQEYAREWLFQEYHKGFLNKTSSPDQFVLNNLYGMLDVFVVSRKEEYDHLFSLEEKHELDDWYFDAYYTGLTPDEKGRLTEEDVRTALKEVKMALLEADVNFRVVKQFVKSVEERAIGQDVMNGLNPGQMVIKIVNEELVAFRFTFFIQVRTF